MLKKQRRQETKLKSAKKVRKIFILVLCRTPNVTALS